MAEQFDILETMLPAEGRCDVAEDLAEEQRNAYSAHHVKTSSQGEKATLKRQQEGDQNTCVIVTDSWLVALSPAEGRCDIAVDLEEEQCNAYSAHHVGTSS
jgi:hypothetical protein